MRGIASAVAAWLFIGHTTPGRLLRDGRVAAGEPPRLVAAADQRLQQKCSCMPELQGMDQAALTTSP